MILYTQDGKVDRSKVDHPNAGKVLWDYNTGPEELADALDAANAALRESQAEAARLREALQRLLDTRENEAATILVAQNAAENFTDPDPEFKAVIDAMLAASEATKQARAALAEARKDAERWHTLKQMVGHPYDKTHLWELRQFTKGQWLWCSADLMDARVDAIAAIAREGQPDREPR